MIRRTRKRYERVGDARYLTFSCYRREPLFDDDRIRRVFTEQLMHAREAMGFGVLAWVIMPEHVHVLVMPEPPDVTVTRVLQTLKRRSSARSLEIIRGSAPDRIAGLCDANGLTRFWQKGGGYDRNIYSRDELIEKINYIHENPVRRGLVKYSHEWAWSSARAHRGMETEWPEIDVV
ncbi:MAG: transposase [Phycisphaeraceae bacterium]|nr:transposase [Phycisphaeraceae bacterium]